MVVPDTKYTYYSHGHSSVLSAKTEPMNKRFLPQVRIGVVGDSQW